MNLLSPYARCAPVSEPIYRFDDILPLGARVQSSRGLTFSTTRAAHPSANRFIGLMTFFLWVPVCIKTGTVPSAPVSFALINTFYLIFTLNFTF